jgi:transcriptional regulatory protein GAL4
MHSIDQK